MATDDEDMHTDGMLLSSGNDEMEKGTFSHLHILYCASIPASQPFFSLLPLLPVRSPLIAIPIIIFWLYPILLLYSPLVSASWKSSTWIHPIYMLFFWKCSSDSQKYWRKSQRCPLGHMSSFLLWVMLSILLLNLYSHSHCPCGLLQSLLT